MIDTLPRSVTIVDVTPRDGLQMETDFFIPSEEKIELVDRLSQTGLTAIQVTSFVHPKAVPQLRDAEAVMHGIERNPAVTYRVLVPNLKGAERAVGVQADEWNLMLSVTDSHSVSNANCTTDEALDRLEPVVQLAHEVGVPVTGGAAVSLGCPFEGFPTVERLVWFYERLYDYGIRTMSLADTVGMANPALVYDRVSRLRERFPDVQFSLHLHDTRGMALANVLAGLQAGIDTFDGAVGGLGGCPYAPGATGNVGTEDLVHMLHEMGIETGVDLDALLDVARRLREIVKHDLESTILRAGKSVELIQEPVTGQRKLG